MYHFFAFILVLVTITSTARGDAPSKDAVKKLVVKMGEAFMEDDHEYILDHSHLLVTELLGGRKKALAFLQKTTEDLKAKELTFSKYDVGDPGDFLKAGGTTYVVVPTTLELTFPKGKIINKTYLLGFSTDDGKTWKFLDGAGLESKKDREKHLPDLPAELALPKLTKPKIIEDK